MATFKNSNELAAPALFDTSHVSPTIEVNESSSERSSQSNTGLTPNDAWNARIQDKGRSIHELGNKAYQRNKFIDIGPGENNTFYYDITAISVNYANIMRTAKDLGTRWDKLSKNPTQMKKKIVERIISLRRQKDDVLIL